MPERKIRNFTDVGGSNRKLRDFSDVQFPFYSEENLQKGIDLGREFVQDQLAPYKKQENVKDNSLIAEQDLTSDFLNQGTPGSFPSMNRSSINLPPFNAAEQSSTEVKFDKTLLSEQEIDPSRFTPSLSEQELNSFNLVGNLLDQDVKEEMSTKTFPADNNYEPLEEGKEYPKNQMFFKKNPIGRLAGSLGQGILSIPEGVAGIGEYLGVPGSEAAAEYLNEWQRAIAPQDPNFAENLTSGIGSMLVFLPFGVGASKAAEMFTKISPKVASWFGASASAMLESATEAGAVYRESNDPRAAEKTFLANMLVITLTNKFGLFAENKEGLKKALLSAPLEGLQESAQEIISASSQGKEPNLENILQSGAIGAIIGAGAGYITPPIEGAGTEQTETRSPLIDEMVLQSMNPENAQRKIIPDVEGIKNIYNTPSVEEETADLPKFEPGRKTFEGFPGMAEEEDLSAQLFKENLEPEAIKSKLSDGLIPGPKEDDIVSDINEYFSSSMEYAEKSTQWHKEKIDELEKELSEIKGRSKEKTQRRKEIKNKIDELSEPIIREQAANDERFELYFQALAKLIDKKASEKGIDLEDEEIMSELYNEISRDITERPGIEHTWQMKLGDVIDYNIELTLKDLEQKQKPEIDNNVEAVKNLTELGKTPEQIAKANNIPLEDVKRIIEEEFPEKKASIPIMITNQMKFDLIDLDYTPEEIRKMKPEEAHNILENKIRKPSEVSGLIDEFEGRFIIEKNDKGNFEVYDQAGNKDVVVGTNVKDLDELRKALNRYAKKHPPEKYGFTKTGEDIQPEEKTDEEVQKEEEKTDEIIEKTEETFTEINYKEKDPRKRFNNVKNYLLKEVKNLQIRALEEEHDEKPDFNDEQMQLLRDLIGKGKANNPFQPDEIITASDVINEKGNWGQVISRVYKVNDRVRIDIPDDGTVYLNEPDLGYLLKLERDINNTLKYDDRFSHKITSGGRSYAPDLESFTTKEQYEQAVKDNEENLAEAKRTGNKTLIKSFEQRAKDLSKTSGEIIEEEAKIQEIRNKPSMKNIEESISDFELLKMYELLEKNNETENPNPNWEALKLASEIKDIYDADLQEFVSSREKVIEESKETLKKYEYKTGKPGYRKLKNRSEESDFNSAKNSIETAEEELRIFNANSDYIGKLLDKKSSEIPSKKINDLKENVISQGKWTPPQFQTVEGTSGINSLKVTKYQLPEFNNAIIYVRENLRIPENFTISSGERWGMKHGRIPKSAKQVLEITADKVLKQSDDWGKIKDRIAEIDAIGDGLAREVIENNKFTPAWAESIINEKEGEKESGKEQQRQEIKKEENKPDTSEETEPAEDDELQEGSRQKYKSKDEVREDLYKKAEDKFYYAATQAFERELNTIEYDPIKYEEKILKPKWKSIIKDSEFKTPDKVKEEADKGNEKAKKIIEGYRNEKQAFYDKRYEFEQQKEEWIENYIVERVNYITESGVKDFLESDISKEKVPKKSDRFDEKLARGEIKVRPIEINYSQKSAVETALSNVVDKDRLQKRRNVIFYDAENKRIVALDGYALVVISDPSLKKSYFYDPKLKEEYSLIDSRDFKYFDEVEKAERKTSFPPYENVIPEYSNPAYKNVDLKDFLNKLEGLVKANKFFDDPLQIKAKIKLPGYDEPVYFNPANLHRGLKALYSLGVKKIHFYAERPNKAALIKDATNQENFALCMPMRFNAEESGFTLIELKEGEAPTKKTRIKSTQKTSKSKAAEKDVPIKQVRKAKSLRGTAKRMENQIQAKLHPAVAEQNPTPRRARMAENMMNQGRRLQEIQQTLFQLADLMEEGTLPKSLEKVSSKIDVELLRKRREDFGIPVHTSNVLELLKTAEGLKGIAEIKKGFDLNIPEFGYVTGKMADIIIQLVELVKSSGREYSDYYWEDRIKDYQRYLRLGIDSQAKLDKAKEDLKNVTDVELSAEDQKRIKLKKEEDKLIGAKIPGYFDTRGDALNRVMDLAEIEEDTNIDVLEPSAGKGNIAEKIKEANIEPDVIEINHTLRNILELKGFNLVGNDFLEYKGKKYDRIIMNPPFEQMQDVDHVRHAYSLLKPGGKLVSVMSESPFFRGDKKATEFREWFEEVGGYEEQLPAKSFVGKGGSRNTSVSARVVVIDKNGQTYDSRISGPMDSKQKDKSDVMFTKSEFSESDLNDIVRLREIGKALSNELKYAIGSDVRTGSKILRRLRPKNVIGTYFPASGIVRVKNINDVSTLAHEIGHKLDFEIFGATDKIKFDKGDKIDGIVTRANGIKNEARRKKTLNTLREKYGAEEVDSILERAILRKELKAFTRKIGHYSDKTVEGVAEFISRYVVEPEVARTEAPKFNNFFENLLDANPDIRKALLSAREQVKAFNSQDPRQITESTIARDEQTDSFIQKIKKTVNGGFYFNVIDGTAPYRELEKELFKLNPKMEGKDNPLLQVLTLIGVDGKAKQFLENHPFRRKGSEIEILKNKKSFFQIFEKMLKDGTLKSHEGYLTALRNIELHNTKRSEAATTSYDHAVETKRLYEEQLGADYLHQLVQDLREYNNTLLDYYADSGKISQKQLDKIKELNKYYVPFKRFFDLWESSGQMPSVSKYVKDFAPSPVKKIKGSMREVVSPVGSLIKNTYDMIAAADRNTTLKTIVSSLQKISPSFVQEIPAKVFRGVKVFEPGIEVDEDGMISLGQSRVTDRIGMFFEKPKNAEIVTVFEDGKATYYQIPKNYYDSLFSINEQVGKAIKVLSIPTRILQAGAVIFDPTFAVRNVPRDQTSAFFYSKYGYNPFDFIKGVFTGIGKKESYQKFLAAGADQSFLTAMDKMLSKSYMEERTGRRVRTTFQKYKRNPLEILRDLNRATELGTRIGAFKKAYLKTGDVYRAMQEGREIAADYGVKGKAMANISPLYAFFNARIQHAKMSLQTMKNHPVKFLTRGITFITIPSIINWFINNWDDETHRRYLEIPLWRRMAFFNIHIPGTDIFLPIPKGFFGTLFATSAEATLDWMRYNDPDAINQLYASLFEELSPMTNATDIVPTGGRPIVEQFANKKGYTSGPIVSERLKRLAPEDQYYESTPEIIKYFGRFTGLSPVRVEHLITAYTAGAGRGALYITDEVLQVLNIVDKKPEDTFTIMSKLPVTRALVTEPPFGTRGYSVTKFYDKLNELEEINQTVNKFIKDEKANEAEKYLQGKQADYQFYIQNQTEINKFVKVLSTVRDLRYEISKDPKIEDKRAAINKIEKKVTEIAVDFQEAYEKKGEFTLDDFMKEILNDKKNKEKKSRDEIKQFRIEFGNEKKSSGKFSRKSGRSGRSLRR